MSKFDIRAHYGFPPKIDDFFGEVEPTDESGWDYRLWVEEWAEPYLGRDTFSSLAGRFAATPGVSEVEHMDREVFLIKSKLDAGQLRDLLWAHFVVAAKSGL